MANPLRSSDVVEQLLAQQSRWADLIERLQGPERAAMKFMCAAYRAIDVSRGFDLLERELAVLRNWCEPEHLRLEGLGLARKPLGIPSPEIYEFLITLPSTAPEVLARDYAVPMKVVAEWLDTSAKTISRRDKVSLLSRTESDVALRYGRVFEQAKEAFGTEDAAREWLTQAQPSLGGVVPVELLRSELGARQVERVLRLIDYGDYI